MTRLPVEVAGVSDRWGHLPHRYTQGARSLDDDPADAVLPVHVLMRVDVGRLSVHQLPEGIELPLQLPPDRVQIVKRHDLVQLRPGAASARPFAQIEVQAHAEPRVLPRVSCRFLRRRPPHHHAGAGQNPVLMCRDESAVHSKALPKSSPLTIRVRFVCAVSMWSLIIP